MGGKEGSAIVWSNIRGWGFVLAAMKLRASSL